MILGQSWIKKHRVIINIKNNFLAFWPSYCIHIKVISLITLSQTKLLATIEIIRIGKNITF